ncbi:MAG: hypothetical protein HFG39_10570 [Lachnospiraceae bacterium]|nr:hypothetical protein [Lachnospiraceae bacterium]
MQAENQQDGDEKGVRGKGMRKRIQFYFRTFQCPDCGNKMFASKMKGFEANGHRKNLYCPRCKTEKTMEQIEMNRCY